MTFSDWFYYLALPISLLIVVGLFCWIIFSIGIASDALNQEPEDSD